MAFIALYSLIQLKELASKIFIGVLCQFSPLPFKNISIAFCFQCNPGLTLTPGFSEQSLDGITFSALTGFY